MVFPLPLAKKRSREAIYKFLSNKKYVGNVLLQKTMSEDGYQVKNPRELSSVLIRNYHSDIISDGLFESIQHIKFEYSKEAANDQEMKILIYANIFKSKLRSAKCQ